MMTLKQVRTVEECDEVDRILSHPQVRQFIGLEDMLMPPGRTYMLRPQFVVLLFRSDEKPLGAFGLLEKAENVAEVHVAFLPEGRGEMFIHAVALVKDWLRTSRFRSVIAEPPSERLALLLTRVGFKEIAVNRYQLEVA